MFTQFVQYTGFWQVRSGDFLSEDEDDDNKEDGSKDNNEKDDHK